MGQYKIPTFLGLFTIALATGIGVLLVQNQKNYKTSASPDEIPDQVKITNISDRNITISWTTDKQTSGFIAYGKSDNLGATVNQPNPSLIHYITLDNLTPETKYYFKIGSGKNLYDNNGLPYEVKTAPSLKQVQNTDIIFGNIKLSSSSSSSQAIVYVSIPGTSQLSALTDSQGKWTVLLSTARSSSLVSYTVYDKERTPIEIYVQGENGKFATAKTTTKLSRPVPIITLGQNHDFSSSLTSTIQTNINPQKEDQSPTSQLSLPDDTSSAPSPTPSATPGVKKSPPPVKKVTIEILSPKKGEQLEKQKPVFEGVGTPDSDFTIKVQSTKTYTDSVSVGQNGKWSWEPPNSLNAGNHTVTVSWIDENGQAKTTEQNFVILAAVGSNVVSTSPVPTPKPSPNASVAPSKETSFLLKSGNLTQTFMAFIIGIVVFAIGLFLPKTSPRN